MSSSEYTEGWEQFVCCLPNMSQDIIDDIKKREPVDNVMNVVAQYWLDNGSDPIWLTVINALKKAKQTTLVQHVLDTYILSSGIHVCIMLLYETL